MRFQTPFIMASAISKTLGQELIPTGFRREAQTVDIVVIRTDFIIEAVPTQLQSEERTAFGETDFSALCVYLEKRVTKRSLAVLYTNFTTLVEARRQLPYLQNLSRRHCLLVVFFEDDDVRAYAASPAGTTEDYYRHVIAEKFIYEKRQIVALLKQHGIMALLTSPARLTVDVINKYIEIKTRQLL